MNNPYKDPLAERSESTLDLIKSLPHGNYSNILLGINRGGPMSHFRSSPRKCINQSPISRIARVNLFMMLKSCSKMMNVMNQRRIQE